MIDSVVVKNFRCFQSLVVENCRRLNVLVGDNGSGKTSFLEALFMTLAGNLEVSVRLRAHRGVDAAFNATPRAIEEAIWRGYFHNFDWSKQISVALVGRGPEARSLIIARSSAQLEIPIGTPSEFESATVVAPLVFTWTDSEGHPYPLSPRFTENRMQFQSSKEDLPDFFHFPASNPVSSAENANRLSDLRKARRDREFVRLVTEEYDWIEDLSVETLGGSPVIFASVRGLEPLIPLPDVSGGINRLMGFLLAMATRPRSVVIIDEIDNGLHHKHHVGMWRAILRFARSYESQLFVSTHNDEWLEALFEATGDKVDDIALWRFAHPVAAPQSIVRKYTGKQFAAAIKTGEVR